VNLAVNPAATLAADLSGIPDLTMQGDADLYADLYADARPGSPAGAEAAARTPTVGRLAGLVRQVAGRPAHWWHLVHFDGVPAPVPVPVPGAERCELWLSAWPPGHRADRRADVLAVLAGELAERTITPQGVAERVLRANRVRVYGGGRPRELVNPGPSYAISLHATAG
jgi:hypothetical protein